MKLRKVLTVFVFATLLVLSLATPAAAGAPVVLTGGDDIDYPEPEGFCPGFEVRDHEIFSFTVRMWLDEQGNVLRSEVHYEGVDNFYNPLHPDVTLSGHFVGNGYYNALNGQNYTTGVPYHITIPGYGTALVRAGRWFSPEYPDGKLAGKDSFDDPKDMAQFCAYLSGN